MIKMKRRKIQLIRTNKSKPIKHAEQKAHLNHIEKSEQVKIEHQEPAKHVNPKIHPWHVPWIVLGVLLLISGALLLPTKIASYQVEVPYMVKEQYSVQVPYEVVEPYTVQVPYQTTEQFVQSIPVQEQQAYTDVECAFLGLFCQGVTKYKTVTVYKDTVQERPVTQYRDETRYRTVTKTRTEVREREVQKIRIERHYKEVNWMWDFDAVIKFNNNLPPPEIIG